MAIVPAGSGNRGKDHRIIAGQYHWQRARFNGDLHFGPQFFENRQHFVYVAGPGMFVIRLVNARRTVAVIGDLESRAGEAVEKTGRAQGCGSALLTAG